jgi:hypothetical protein
MDDILKELSQIQTTEYELHKIQALHDTLEQVSLEVKKQNQNHLEHITNTFNNKLKTNPNFQKVVNNYVDKFVKEDMKDQAKEELFLILTGEMMGMFRGITQSKCSIM